MLAQPDIEMSTPEDKIAAELRIELEARIQAWETERQQLQLASARIAELDALIAFARDDNRTQFRVAPRVRPESPPGLEQRPEALPQRPTT
jgi:hypothetical protein